METGRSVKKDDAMDIRIFEVDGEKLDLLRR